MMVVHEDNERPVEVAVIRKPLLEQKSYVIVKNHVRELPSTAQNTIDLNVNEGKSPLSSENEDALKQKRKTVKKHKKTEEMATSSKNDFIPNSITEIDSKDLDDLRKVYTKCKEVMKRIESKYGHLLNLNSESEPRLKNMKRKMNSETSEDECNCKFKTKIVFDDEGKQSTVDTASTEHICVKKMKKVPSESQIKNRNIAIEYQDAEIGLPDDLQELGNMLHDPDLENSHRYKILDKIRTLKQEYTNEVRFNKHIIIEKLKSNPEEVLEFKGSNLSTIPGYS